MRVGADASRCLNVYVENSDERDLHAALVIFHKMPEPEHFLHTLVRRSMISPLMFDGLRATGEFGFTSPRPLHDLHVFQNVVI